MDPAIGGNRLLIILALCMILIIAQYVLSVQNSKFLGLILPVLLLAAGLGVTLTGLTPAPPAAGDSTVHPALSLLLGILPAAVFFVVYITGRKQVKKRTAPQAAEEKKA